MSNEPLSKKQRSSLRSDDDLYDSTEHCICCGQPDRYKGKKPKFALTHVTTLNFLTKLEDDASKRSDEWKTEVLHRVSYIRSQYSNLKDADNGYHKECRKKIQFTLPENSGKIPNDRLN